MATRKAASSSAKTSKSKSTKKSAKTTAKKTSKKTTKKKTTKKKTTKKKTGKKTGKTTVKKALAPDEDGHRRLDFGKMMEARKESNERVKNLLSESQYEKYRSEGYGAPLGLGGASIVSTAVVTPGSDEDK